ncbi:MAG: hypothetical protein M1830_006912, partial [Pleopsidium flavum]
MNDTSLSTFIPSLQSSDPSLGLLLELYPSSGSRPRKKSLGLKNQILLRLPAEMAQIADLPPELLHPICQFVTLHGVQHIKSLRLCNRCIEKIASEYLFPRLLIGPRKRLLRRLRRVAASPKFARGVRELEYDTTRYSAWTFVAYDELMIQRSLKGDERSSKARWHYWQNLYRSQNFLIMTGEVYSVLVLALPHFSNVQVVTISDRYADHRCDSQDAPLTVSPRLTSVSGPQYQIHGYLSLVQAFASTSHKLREFAVYPEQDKEGEILIHMLQLPPEGLKWTKATFEHLTTIAFKFYTDVVFQPLEDRDIEEILKK